MPPNFYIFQRNSNTTLNKRYPNVSTLEIKSLSLSLKLRIQKTNFWIKSLLTLLENPFSFCSTFLQTKWELLENSLSLSLSNFQKLSWSPTTTKTQRPSNSSVFMAGKSSLATPTTFFITPEAWHVSLPLIALFLSQVCVLFRSRERERIF